MREQFHNACIGEKDYYTTSSDQSVAAITRNSGACIVLGNGGNRDVTIANGGSLTTPGTYYDEITGNKFVVTKDKITGKVGSIGEGINQGNICNNCTYAS